MNLKLDKKARKTSTDPVQEHLRQHKSEWNGSTSDLITGLISLKRGLNGRGDARAGLPPSLIKEPFPPEIISYLNEVAARYEKVMEGATSIIREQEEYSLHRKKPNNITAELETVDLIALGSNPVSRLWSKFVLWKHLDKINRINRLRMLKECASFVKELKEVKSTLLKQDFDSIPNSMGQIAAIGERYLEIFIKRYDILVGESIKTIESEKAIKQLNPSTESSSENSTEEELPPVGKVKEEIEEKTQTPEKIEELSPVEQKVESQIPETLPTSNPPLVDDVKYKFYTEQIHYANFILHYLDNNVAAIAPTKVKNFRKILLNLSNRVASLFVLSTNSDVSLTQYMVDTVDLSKLIELIQKDYDNLLVLANKLTNNTSTDFKELANKIKAIKVSTYFSSVKQQEILTKMASNAIERWFRHNLLKISPNSQQRLLLDIVKETDKIIENFDLVMNSLENPNSTIHELDSLVIKLNETLSNIVRLILIVGRIYFSIAQKQPEATHYLMSIRDKIRRLSLIEEALKSRLEPLQLE